MVECESLTTTSVAPAARAPSMAALTSASSSRRPAAASGPSPMHWSQSTTPAVPSMSLDRKTFNLVSSGWGVPVAAADALAERAAVELRDRRQRAVGRIADPEHERRQVALRDAEDLADPIMVTDRRMAGADAEVGRRDHHRVGGLTKVVTVNDLHAPVGRLGDAQHDRGRRLGDVAGALPGLRQLGELLGVGDEDEIPVLAV